MSARSNLPAAIRAAHILRGITSYTVIGAGEHPGEGFSRVSELTDAYLIVYYHAERNEFKVSFVPSMDATREYLEFLIHLQRMNESDIFIESANAGDECKKEK